MSIIEKAINKLEKEKGRDALLGGDPVAPQPARPPEPAAQASAVDSAAPVAAGPLPDNSGERHNPPTGPVHQLPLETLSNLGMLTPLKPRSRIADEYRTIKRPLLMNIEKQGAATVDNANLIMVTSALPGEGKTFSAINLAMSIATEQDRTVLLVDADVTKASAAAVLGIPDDSPGLIDLLENPQLSFSDVLIKTDVPKLRVLPAGHLHEHATELLASDNMRQMMKELSQRYPDRVIIFDSPPLLITTEATVLASLMGQIVFVVSAGNSSHLAVEEAIEHIGEDKVVGLVLNKARAHPLSKHGYGYGYGYKDDDQSRYRRYHTPGGG